jgi:hypothetical protein
MPPEALPDISWDSLARLHQCDPLDFQVMLPLFRAELSKLVRSTGLGTKGLVYLGNGIHYLPHALDHPHTVIANSPLSGHGVFAGRDIAEGSTVCCFEGLVLESPFSSCLPNSDPECIEDHAQQLSDHLHVYPRFRMAFFMNHGCEPNVYFRDVDNCLVTLKDVPAGQELVWDYSSADTTEWEVGHCNCGSPSCRGAIRSFEYLPDDTVDRYLKMGIIPSWIIRKYGLGHE